MYFASHFRLRGTDYSFGSKIYSAATTGIRLVAQPAGAFSGRPQGYFRPFVSSDGGRLAFTEDPCDAQGICGTVIDASGRLLARRRGGVVLSPNGRFAVFLQTNADSSEAVRIDLDTGAERTFELPRGVRWNGGLLSTADGRLVYTDGSSLCIAADASGTSCHSTPSGVSSFAIDAMGRTALFFDDCWKCRSSLRRMDLDSGMTSVLLEQPSGSPQAQLSLDGSRAVLVLQPSGVTDLEEWRGQIFIMNSDGSGLRQITHLAGASISADYNSVVLSGDGSKVWASTSESGILQIDIASGAVTEVIPPTIRPFGLFGVPGSLRKITSANAVDFPDVPSPKPPLPMTLGVLAVRIDGKPAPIARVFKDEMWVQIPWDLTPGYRALEIDTNSPFSSLAGATIWEELEFLHRMDQSHLVAAAMHEDFRGLVSQSDPASPNEVVQFFMSGLGPVSPEVPTGAASPVAPPASAIRPITCRALAPSPPVDSFENLAIEFAGLAPGFVGVYQVNMRMPRQFPGAWAKIRCDPGFLAEAFLPVRAAP